MTFSYFICVYLSPPQYPQTKSYEVAAQEETCFTYPKYLPISFGLRCPAAEPGLTSIFHGVPAHHGAQLTVELGPLLEVPDSHHAIQWKPSPGH